jgi:hypothetical protein
VSVTRAAYDASFAKLVSLVAYRDSRSSEDQRIPRDLFHWLAKRVFLNSVPASWVFWVRWEHPPSSNN